MDFSITMYHSINYNKSIPNANVTKVSLTYSWLENLEERYRGASGTIFATILQL